MSAEILSRRLTRGQFLKTILAGAAVLVLPKTALADYYDSEAREAKKDGNTTAKKVAPAAISGKPYESFTKKGIFEQFNVELLSVPEYIKQGGEYWCFSFIEDITQDPCVVYPPDWNQDSMSSVVDYLLDSPKYLHQALPTGHLRLVSSIDSRVKLGPKARNFIELDQKVVKRDSLNFGFLHFLHESIHRATATDEIPVEFNRDFKDCFSPKFDPNDPADPIPQIISVLTPKKMKMVSPWISSVTENFGGDFLFPPEDLQAWAGAKAKYLAERNKYVIDPSDPDYFDMRLVYGIRVGYPLELIAVSGELACQGRDFFRDGLKKTRIFTPDQISWLEDFSYRVLLNGMDPKYMLVNR